MGMYDNLRFSYPMPNGYVGTEYQTKSLDCQRDQYEVTTSGRLTRKSSEPDEEFALAHPDYFEAPTDTHFSGQIFITALAGTRQRFELSFFAGTLQSIRDVNTDQLIEYRAADHMRHTLALSVSDAMASAALAEAIEVQVLAEPRDEDERNRMLSAMKRILRAGLCAGVPEAPL